MVIPNKSQSRCIKHLTLVSRVQGLFLKGSLVQDVSNKFSPELWILCLRIINKQGKPGEGNCYVQAQRLKWGAYRYQTMPMSMFWEVLWWKYGFNSSLGFMLYLSGCPSQGSCSPQYASVWTRDGWWWAHYKMQRVERMNECNIYECDTFVINPTHTKKYTAVEWGMWFYHRDTRWA